MLTILREEGIEGLYKGVGSKLVQSVLTAAILFAGQKRIYEMTKKVRFALSPPSSNSTELSLSFVGTHSCAGEIDGRVVFYPNID